MGPLRDECATEGFYLCAEDTSGHVGQSAGPIFPLSKIEGAQRVAINNAALGDITSLLDGPHKDSDVCFVVEGRQLHAHKCILSARCEAFRGMFNSPMREGSKGPLQVEMPEVKAQSKEDSLSGQKGYMWEYVRKEAMAKLGIDESQLDRGGYNIVTTFDAKRMKEAEQAINDLVGAQVGARAARACPDAPPLHPPLYACLLATVALASLLHQGLAAACYRWAPRRGGEHARPTSPKATVMV